MPHKSEQKTLLIEDNWARYEYARSRGHTEYVRQAKRNEEYYLGGGKQWTEADKKRLDSERRPHIEMNEVMSTVNAAVGYQIANRMDIAFRPRNNKTDQEAANIMGKVAKQIQDNNRYHWKETEVVEDGFIEQRGYFDCRMSFDDSLFGEVKIDVLDPRDVIPDPDAKSYDPDDWADVMVTRWMTLDQIEQWYGKNKRDQVEAAHEPDEDWEENSDEERSKFGMDGGAFGPYSDMVRGKGKNMRVRVVDRQYWRMQVKEVLVTPEGDIRVVDELTPDRKDDLTERGSVLTRLRTRCVYWTVSTSDVMLFHDQSPYRHFTVVPFFPYFRRGQTRGIVDNIRGPQDLLNKSVSQILHTINTTANSGWIIEQNSLANMEVDELEQKGATTGLVLEFRQGARVPEKIESNRVPSGLDRLVDRASVAIPRISGINASLKGMDEEELSGVAMQARQYAGQQQIARPLDNLARTRHMVTRMIMEMVQTFYQEERIIRITEKDQYGRESDEFVTVNQATEQGILNDLTIGEYDIVITEQPMSVTFENSQFEQAMRMREAGVRISDAYVVRHSNLADKHDLAEQMANPPQTEEQKKTAAEIEEIKAKAQKALADAERIRADAVNKSVEAAYSSIQTAGAIVDNPLLSGVSDALLRSAGFEDKDQPPIVPSEVPAVEGNPGTNTNPLTPENPELPASPREGVRRGIETTEL